MVEATDIDHSQESMGLIPEKLLGPSLSQLKEMAKREIADVKGDATKIKEKIREKTRRLGLPEEEKIEWSDGGIGKLVEVLGSEKYGYLWKKAETILNQLGQSVPLGVVMEVGHLVRAGALITPSGWALIEVNSFRAPDDGTGQWIWSTPQEEADNVIGLHLLDTELAKHGLRLDMGNASRVNRVTPIPPAQRTFGIER